jgi:hypothetical protein
MNDHQLLRQDCAPSVSLLVFCSLQNWRRWVCRSLEDREIWQFKCSVCIIMIIFCFNHINVLIFLLSTCLFRLPSIRPNRTWGLLHVPLPYSVILSGDQVVGKYNKTSVKSLWPSSKWLRTKGFTRNILPSPFIRVFQGVKEAVFIINMATTVPRDIRCWKLIWRQQLTRERRL